MKRKFAAAFAATLLALPAFAEGIMIKDAYARASGPNAKAGAAFMQIMNHSDSEDRLIGASADVAKRVELHTHKDMGDGVMKMMEVEEGFAVPAGGMHALARGGDHVMFMGLNQSFIQGETISVTLTFEQAGDVVVEIPIDNERKGGHGSMDHSGHGMKKDENS
ncbi:copper chaperone PCu(A)C [Primorskyibacter sp. S187A]|uniref:copper chaperone PCu(A)C n=1 Tax=Primorskyibacter sp. S187A TaxID=3415130 RepID=UPI003C7E3CA5